MRISDCSADVGSTDLHLFRFALGHLPLVQPQAVLESVTHMATHRGRLRGNFHLTGSCRENRPAILILEQSVGSALHMEHLFRVRADTAEQTEAGLDKKWPLDETLLPEIVQIMEVARVVAFELVARRSEERHVGKEWVSACRSRGSADR